MTSKLTRRQAISGSIATATALTFTSEASAKPHPLNDKLDAMQAAIADVNVMEVTGSKHAPHYRKGDLVFVKPETAKATDHVCLKTKSGQQHFAALVHSDQKAIYLRGFNPKDRMQIIPRTSVASWGRVVASFRP
jgi:SOS-response transcriptional repressor LexA